MSWISNLLTEGWPMLVAMAMVFILTFGALRPYLKKDRARRERMEQSND